MLFTAFRMEEGPTLKISDDVVLRDLVAAINPKSEVISWPSQYLELLGLLEFTLVQITDANNFLRILEIVSAGAVVKRVQEGPPKNTAMEYMAEKIAAAVNRLQSYEKGLHTMVQNDSLFLGMRKESE